MATANLTGMSLAKARDILRGVEGIADVYDRGYRWVHTTFEPAVLRLSTARSLPERSLAAEGFYLLGDVHDFNHAPRAAIYAYRKCLAIDPTEAAAWREIGGCYDAMGNDRLAHRALRRSLALDPMEEYATADMSALEEYGVSATYRAGDRVWQAAEHLARGRFNLALRSLGRARKPAMRLQRARILGAMGDIEGVMGEWRKLDAELTIRRRTWRTQLDVGGAELTHADWFFLPEALWDDAAFWGQQWRLRGRLFACNLPPRCSRRDDFFPPFAARLRFHLARTKGDLRAARRLSDRYHEWKAARALVVQLGQLE